MKIQRKISLIFWTDFILALISRHFIGLSRYFRLWKVMSQIKEPVSNEFKEIELKIQEITFSAKSWILSWILCQNSTNNLFIWYIFIYHVKYFDKPMNCLEIRATINFKRLISKFPNHFRILADVLSHWKTYGQINKQELLVHSLWNTL